MISPTSIADLLLLLNANQLAAGIATKELNIWIEDGGSGDNTKKRLVRSAHSRQQPDNCTKGDRTTRQVRGSRWRGAGQ
jgi:hypothetical protein